MDPDIPWLPTSASGFPEASTSMLSSGFGGAREADATPTSYSQVPGTSGAPPYTPSATPGGVSSGSGRGVPAAPFSLAGLLGLNAPQTAAGATRPGQGMKIAQLGMRMLAPPASPLQAGAPQPRLSTAGQNPMLAQIQQLYGVDPSTAQLMLQTLYGGGATMQPSQSPLFTSGATPQALAPPQNPLLPSSAMPTAAQPYGTPRMGMATPTANLPPLTQGAFAPAGGYNQGLFGIPQMAEGGRPTGPTLVGERGPEVFVPDVPGSIVPMPRSDPRTAYRAIANDPTIQMFGDIGRQLRQQEQRPIPGYQTLPWSSDMPMPQMQTLPWGGGPIPQMQLLRDF